MLRAHMLPIDVGEDPIPGLSDDGEAPRLGRTATGPRHVVGDERVAHDADAVRIGQRDRRGEHPRLHEPGQAGDRVPHARFEPPNRDPHVAGAGTTARRASRRAKTIIGHHETGP